MTLMIPVLAWAQCLDYTPILVPTAVLWISTNFPPSVVCADLAMCEAAKTLRSLLSQVITGRPVA